MRPGPSRMRVLDVLRTGFLGLSSRRLRAALSAVGVAIGIASMVAVLGLSESSRSDLLSALDRLGTNLLKVEPGRTFAGEDAELPETARAMTGRVTGVERSASVKTLEETVRRSDLIPEEETGGIAVAAADPGVLRALGAGMRRGAFLTVATARYPAVVLGAEAARTLGIRRTGVNVAIGGRPFAVVGVMDRVALDPDLDATVFIGYRVAERLFGADRSPSTIYVRAATDSVREVRGLLGAAANPQHPEEVQVSRPSDALAARAAAKTALTSLLLGLGAVALLVGGVGIANVMVVSVLERRSEIGLRRALGAAQRHVGSQFLAESLMLAGMGGAAGVVLGAGVTVAYAASRGWTPVLPPEALVGGLAAALAIGALAGVYPALRAARLAPTDALRAA